MGAFRAALIAWGVAVASLGILSVVYAFRVASAAGLAAVPDAFARFSFSNWRAVDAVIVITIVVTLATGFVAISSARRAPRISRAMALMLESIAAALAYTVPVLSVLILFAFMLGPGPCSAGFYDASAPGCAARDAGLLTNMLAGLLALPLIGTLSLAVLAIKRSLPSTFVSVLIVSFGGLIGAGTGVALTGLVPTEPFERVARADAFMSGVVTDLGTGAPTKSRIEIYQADSPCCVHVDEAFTAADGRYDVELRPGRYRILFVPFDWNVAVSAEWWTGANSFETGNVVTIPGGGANVDARLRARSRISGRVTSAATTLAIPQMDVSAVFSLVGGARYVARARTDAEGRYSLQLPAGTYFVEFEKIGYLPSVWRDVGRTGAARTVTVADGDVANIDQVVPAPRQ